MARELTRMRLAERGNTDVPPVEEIPLEYAAHAIRSNGWSFLHADSNTLWAIAYLLPWAVNLDAEDFFLPRSMCRRSPFPWRPEDSLALLESHRQYAPRKPEPQCRAVTKLTGVPLMVDAADKLSEATGDHRC